jgi:hypothetical protein
MSHLHSNIITLAEDVEDAKSEVRIWLEDYAGREFFDYGGLLEKVSLVKDIAVELEKQKDVVLELLPDIEQEINRCKAEEKRTSEGYHHIRYGRILSEECCCEMPFFNIHDGDWSIPIKNEFMDGREWFAVMVDLHY